LAATKPEQESFAKNICPRLLKIILPKHILLLNLCGDFFIYTKVDPKNGSERGKKYMKKKTIILITMTVLLAGGALLANSWVGQVSADSGSTTDALMMMTKGGPGGSDEDLAAALGISVEDLTAAVEKAFTSAVDAALEAETITASQAETLKEGNTNFRSLYRYLGETERAEFDQDVYLAEALGITKEELADAVAAVKQARIDQLVADGVLTQEQADLQAAIQALRGSSTFEATMKQAMTDAINAEVTAGTLTQTQADLLIANLAEMPIPYPMGMHGMRGMEGFGGMGGHRGPGGR